MIDAGTVYGIYESSGGTAAPKLLGVAYQLQEADQIATERTAANSWRPVSIAPIPVLWKGPQ